MTNKITIHAYLSQAEQHDRGTIWGTTHRERPPLKRSWGDLPGEQE